MAKKRTYDDDDGHTVADMSGLAPRPSMFFPRLPQRQGRAEQPAPQPERQEDERPWEEFELSPEERRWYILGVLKAALLIALAFIAGLGLIVFLFYLLA